MTTDLPYPVENLLAENADIASANRSVAHTFRTAATAGVLMSLGASDLRVVPGMHQLGGLLFCARILPLDDTKRAERPRIMAVMVSLTGADTIDVDVRYLAGGREHATIRDIYIDQLQLALLALDYDGPTALNPVYWTS